MMAHVLASDGLAPWGQTAAIVLMIYLFFLIIMGLALMGVLMVGFAWIRQKSELLRQLRPQVNQVNRAFKAVKRGDPLPEQVADNQFISTITRVPGIIEGVAGRVEGVEDTVERGSQRVADVVIEIYARKEMIKGMARAFFLPGLTRPRQPAPIALPIPQAAVELEREQSEREQPEIEAGPVQYSPREEPPMEQEMVIRRR